jgi:hypothetical protein
MNLKNNHVSARDSCIKTNQKQTKRTSVFLDILKLFLDSFSPVPERSEEYSFSILKNEETNHLKKKWVLENAEHGF